MAKSVKKTEVVKTSSSPANTYQPSEMVIKEMMIQKNCSREDAVNILKNPTPHPESTSPKTV